MYSPGNPYFNLSEEGEKEFGHIFPEGVPLKQETLITEAKLEGIPNDTDFVVYVDWAKLSEEQQTKCLDYMSEKSMTDIDIIRSVIEARGYFPLRKQFIIEAYDMRLFI